MLSAFHAINIIGKVAHVALVESRRGSDPRECGLVALALLERDLRGSQRLIVADIDLGRSLRARSHTVLATKTNSVSPSGRLLNVALTFAPGAA